MVARRGYKKVCLKGAPGTTGCRDAYGLAERQADPPELRRCQILLRAE
jgi:hypothetical protein